VRETYGPNTTIGKRRTQFDKAPDEAIAQAATEASLMVDREPITVVLSEKGWVRALRGKDADVSNLSWKGEDQLKLHFNAETTSRLLAFATNGRFYTIDASKLPGGRGHGEPIRLYAELDQGADIVDMLPYAGKRKFLVASRSGNGFIVSEDDVLGTTRKGKQVLNVKAPDRAMALSIAEGDQVAVIGDNRKMLIFPLSELPEMGRGRGVRMQKYKEGGLKDAKTFALNAGLTWLDSAGRTFTSDRKEIAEWRGKRADAGRLAPKGFPKSGKFR
jgi:topoisomerase-4 subunit A